MEKEEVGKKGWKWLQIKVFHFQSCRGDILTNKQKLPVEPRKGRKKETKKVNGMSTFSAGKVWPKFGEYCCDFHENILEKWPGINWFGGSEQLQKMTECFFGDLRRQQLLQWRWIGCRQGAIEMTAIRSLPWKWNTRQLVCCNCDLPDLADQDGTLEIRNKKWEIRNKK